MSRTNNTQKRLTPDERRAVILRAAVRLTERDGLYGWTRADVANACEVLTSPETVKHYWTQPELRAEVERALAVNK